MAQPLTSEAHRPAQPALRRRLQRLFAPDEPLVAPQVWLLLVASSVAIGVLAQARQPLLLAACVVATFVGLWMTVGPSWAAFIVLLQTALLDHYNVRFLGVNLRPEWIAAAIALLTVLTVSWRARRSIQLDRIEWYLLAWLGLNGFASLVFAPRPGASLKAFIGLALVGSAFFVLRRLVGERIERVLVAVLVAGLVTCAFGVAAYLISPLVGSTIGLQLNPNTHVLMATGTLWEADIFGAFAAYVLLLALSWILIRPGHNPLLTAAVVLAAALALEVSLARTAWIAATLGLVIGVAFWVVLIRRMKLGPPRSSFIGLAPLTLGVVLASVLVWTVVGATQAQRGSYVNAPTGPGGVYEIAYAPAATSAPAPPAPAERSPVVSRLGTLSSVGRLMSDGTLRLRLDAARLTIDDWKHQPVFGRGTASFGQVYTDSSHQPWWISNIVLRALHDTGLVGLIVFVLFAIGLSLAPLRRSLERGGQGAALAGVVVVPTAALWLTAQATEPFQLMWPWLLLGLIPVILAIDKQVATRGDGG
jgi:hypothetical protein